MVSQQSTAFFLNLSLKREPYLKSKEEMQRSQVGARENSRTCEDEHNQTGKGTKFRILYDLSPIPLSKKLKKKEEFEQERQKKTNCNAPHTNKHEKERDFQTKKNGDSRTSL